MFDVILGLPLHPLVVHGFVVLGPIVALAAIAYGVLPRRRAAFRWPLLVAIALVGILAIVTRQSGEALRNRLFPLLASGDIPPGAESVWLHTQLAGIAGLLAAAWAVAAIVLVWFFVRPVPRPDTTSARRWTVTEVVAVGVLVVTSVTTIVWIVLAGHSGATAVWGDVIAPSI